MALAAPPMRGAEYLITAILEALWQELDAAFDLGLSESKCGVQDFLKRRSPAWNLVGRVHFNIAENRKDPDSRHNTCHWDRACASTRARQIKKNSCHDWSRCNGHGDMRLARARVDAGEIFHPLRSS